MRVDAAFRELLRDFDLDALDADPATIFGVWSDLRLAYTNAAWDRFAAENGAPHLVERWPIGADTAAAIQGPLARWLRELVVGTRRLRPEGLVYRCSSLTLQREFRLTVYPLSTKGLLLVHSLIKQVRGESIRENICESAPDPSAYRNADGFLSQCSHCQRFLAMCSPPRWDWIPAWNEDLPDRTSHGLCPVCIAIYYPEDPWREPDAS